MRKAFFKQAAVLALAAAMVVGTTSTAFAIIGGLDHELSRMSSGSYRNVEVKEVK